MGDGILVKVGVGAGERVECLMELLLAVAFLL